MSSPTGSLKRGHQTGPQRFGVHPLRVFFGAGGSVKMRLFPTRVLKKTCVLSRGRSMRDENPLQTAQSV